MIGGDFLSKHATEFDISVIARLAGLDLNKQELAAAQKDICDMLTLADTLDIMEPIPAVSNFSGTSCTLEDITPTSDDLLSFLNTVSPNGEKYSGERFFLVPDPTNTASSSDPSNE